MKNIPFTYIIVGWLAFLLIDVLKKNILGRGTFEFIAFYYLPSFIWWIAFTYLIHYVVGISSRLPQIRRVLTLLMAGLLIGITKTMVSFITAFGIKFILPGYSPTFREDFLARLSSFYFVEAIIITWVVMAIFYIIDLNEKYKRKSLEAAELQSQLVQAQLQALKMQLQPHFLFNANNTVAMLIRNGSYQQAIKTISNLSELLRISLNNQRGNFVPLSEELRIIGKYLEIEAIRFEDHLQINIEINEKLQSYRVPYLITQPLVENAFKHGLVKHLGQAELSIRARKIENQLLITVYNTGPQLSSSWNSTAGIGLSNTISRLKKLYQNDFNFELKNYKNGVMASLTLPITQ